MRIVTGVEGNWRVLRILDADPGQQMALAELGFGADLVRRYPPDTRYFDRAVANLRQDLDEMVRQSITTGTPPGWAGPLEDVLRRAGKARVPVAVVGSAALAARGVDVRPGDIDVITTTEGADARAELLSGEPGHAGGHPAGFRQIRPGLHRRDPRGVARQAGQGPRRPVAAGRVRVVRRQPVRGNPLGKPDPARATAGGTAPDRGAPPAARPGGRHRRLPPEPRGGDTMILSIEYTAATPDPAAAKVLLQQLYDSLKNGS